MTGPLLLLLAQVAASANPLTDDVIVVGHHAEKELAACLARHCPPAQNEETREDEAREAGHAPQACLLHLRRKTPFTTVNQNG